MLRCRVKEQETAHKAQAAVRTRQLRGAVDSIKEIKESSISSTRPQVELLVDLVKLLVQRGEFIVGFKWFQAENGWQV